MAAQPSPTGPLAGRLVADFSRILAGPYATMLLADLGAEVVKVEAPGGDDTRTWQPPARDGISTYYLGVNRNKRSVALDLRNGEDLAAAQELARRADVLVENFKPGGLARFGLDYDTVAARNPRVVYASISGFGSGPKGRGLPGYDLIVQAMSGLMSLTGDPDGEPYRAGISVFDVMAGLHATIGVLSALNARHDSGRGQHVEVDLLSSALSGLVNQASAVVAGGVVPLPTTQWFHAMTSAGVPCGPINTVDAGVAFAADVGLEPVVLVGDGAAAVPSVRNPIRFSQTPPDYRLPPPSLDEHGEEVRRWLARPADRPSTQESPA